MSDSKLEVNENGQVILPTKRPQVQSLRVDSLTAHPRLQRDLDENRVLKMATEFQPALLGMLLVSRHPGDRLYVLDGMHRHATLLLVDWHNKTVACEVYDDLGIEQEALLFRGRNNTKRLHVLDLHKAAVIQGEPIAVACDELARAHKLVVRRGAANGLVAITALRRVYELNPDAARRALYVATQAWGAVKDAVEAPIIEGLGRLFNRYPEKIDDESLVRKLAKSGMPGTLVGRAKTYAEIHSTRVGPSFAAVVIEIYNRNQRGGKVLESWDGRS